MNQFCSEHGELRQTVGEIKTAIETVSSNVGEIKKAVEAIRGKTFYHTMGKVFIWLLSVAGAGFIVNYLERFFH
jgi:hypothetical protein